MRRTIAVLLAVLLAAACRAESSEVSFRTSDGFRLEGRHFGQGARGVILAHMFPATQSSWASFAAELGEKGYSVLTFNFRGYGGSEGEKRIAVMDRDVVAAIQVMRKELEAERVALVGASMGGTASIIAAAREDVEGVLTLSAPAEFRGLDASSQVLQVTEPKSFIASNGDRPAVGSAKGLLEASLDPNAEIHIIAGDAHGTDLLRGGKAEETRALIERFLEKVFA